MLQRFPSADIRNYRRLTSEVYELVASDGVKFFVHKDILISQSKPFQEAITGEWNEALERRIHLTDWDSDTVACLVEFLYVDDYAYPDPSPIGLEREPTTTDSKPAEVAAGGFEPPLESHRRPLTPFNECLRHGMPPNPPIASTDGQRLERLDPADHDFGQILLAHAKVYALANYKAIDALRELALKRVFLTLARLHPLQSASRSSMGMVDFASYVYANTDHLSRSEEPLRKITSQFLALNLAAFYTEPKAAELVAQGGDLVKDLMSTICRTLPDPDEVFWAGGRPHTRYISGLRVSISLPDISALLICQPRLLPGRAHLLLA